MADAIMMEMPPAQHSRPAMPGPHRTGHRVVLVAATAAVTAALAGAGVTARAVLGRSLGVLAHLDWAWIGLAIVLESASMVAFAATQRRLLAAGRVRVGVRAMLATTFAANALSVSVPLAGPELGTVFTFRRFAGQGADAPLASWSLLVSGMVSAAAGVLVALGGGLSSGDLPVAGTAAVAGLLAVAALVASAAAVRRPRLRDALEQPAAWALRHGSRLLRSPVDDPRRAIRAWAGRLGSLRLSLSGWMMVTGLAMANWLTDTAVLAVSIHAAGAPVPWHVLLLVYGSGVAAQSLNVTPGGLGIAEGTLSLTLAAAGLRASQALAAVLLYRIVSLWLVAVAGWLIVLWLRRHRSQATTLGRYRRPPDPIPAGYHQGPAA